MTQKIIVDENIPRSVIEWLCKRGFETVSVSESHLKGEKDIIIAKYAAENEMPILTLDSDFAKLYHNILRGKITVMLIKATPATPENIIRTLNTALKKTAIKDIQNKLVIISKKRIRTIS